MKKKSASQSAPARRSLDEGGFFNLRVLIGLFIGLAGVSLALAGLGDIRPHLLPTPQQAQQKYKVTTRSQYISPLVPPGFDCATIHQLGIDKMENLRAGAIMIFCGQAKGGAACRRPIYAAAFSKLVRKPDGTRDLWRHGRGPDYWYGDLLRTLFSRRHTLRLTRITPTRSSSLTTTLEAPATSNFSGASISTDGGTHLHPPHQRPAVKAPSPIPLATRLFCTTSQASTWFTIWIDAAAAAGGIGGYKSTTPDGPK